MVHLAYAILPLELCEHVIDTLAEGLPDTKRDLSACALTCRTWLPRTRRHAFREITLRNKNRLRAVASLRSNPSLGLLVRKCTLALEDPGRAYFLREPLSCSITSLLLICISHFPNMHSLSLYFWAGLSREHSDICKLCAYLPQVTTLCILPERETSYSMFCRLLSSFKSVKYVGICSCPFSGGGFVAPPSSGCRMKQPIKGFRLDFGAGFDKMMRLFVTWLLRTGALGDSVERLALYCWFLKEELENNSLLAVLWIMKEVVKECASSLTHFFITYPINIDNPDPLLTEHPDLSLERNTSLQDISIGVNTTFMTAVLHLLGTTATKHLTRLTLHYTFHSITGKPNLEHWKLLDNLLIDRASFRSLAEVVLLVRDKSLHTPDFLYADPLKLVPRLYAKGILTFIMIPSSFSSFNDFCNFW
ncbi:hypothetical protein QCA50_019887 [Cerrena zonata]|uniref:F-box domain-containing protein n=1 Tax=Cerrena zonata TaxID=2478898 RepID=A0AAW0FHU6_9APHY